MREGSAAPPRGIPLRSSGTRRPGPRSGPNPPRWTTPRGTSGITRPNPPDIQIWLLFPTRSELRCSIAAPAILLLRTWIAISRLLAPPAILPASTDLACVVRSMHGSGSPNLFLLLGRSCGGEALSRYEVECDPAGDVSVVGKLQRVKGYTLFETSVASSAKSLRLFELAKALGEEGWIKAINLEEYAPRQPRRPDKLPQVLFPYAEAI